MSSICRPRVAVMLASGGTTGPVLDWLRISMFASPVQGTEPIGGYAIGTRSPPPHFGNRPHPNSLVARLTVPLGRRQAALAPAALRALAEEDLALARADRAEGRRAAPVEALRPAELLEPGEALDDVRDVQDRRHRVREHVRGPRVRRPVIETGPRREPPPAAQPVPYSRLV